MRLWRDSSRSADVITTNWRPGAAARLGLDYATLSQRYPGLIYCNTRGYEKGPRSELPGTDQNAAALTGTEWEDGACDAGNPPLWSRSNMGDTGNALLAAIAITTAIYHRDRTGEGQSVSTSIVNAGLLHASYAWIQAEGQRDAWEHVDGDQYGLSPYYRMYQGSDEVWLFLAAVSVDERARLRALVDGLEASAGDDASVEVVLTRLFAGQSASSSFDLLDGGGVPVEIVDEEFRRALFDDPEAKALKLVAETWSGNVGRFEDPGLLVNMSPVEGVIQRGPSMCGEHSREILMEHGYSQEEVDRLAADNAVLEAAISTTP